MWFAIAAEPPLPHENTVAPLVYASSRIVAARASAASSTELAGSRQSPARTR
jgi:hypothetical protein